MPLALLSYDVEAEIGSILKGFLAHMCPDPGRFLGLRALRTDSNFGRRFIES